MLQNAFGDDTLSKMRVFEICEEDRGEMEMMEKMIGRGL